MRSQAPEGLDGLSLTPLLREPTMVTNRKITTTFDPGNISARSERWRYIRYEDGSEELYDHKTDPHEWTNLAKCPEHQSKLDEFR